MNSFKSKQFPLHIHVSALFVMLTLVVGGLLLAVGYVTSRTLINTMAGDMSLRIGRETSAELQRILQPVETVVHVLALDELSRETSHAQRMQRLEFVRGLLDRHPALSSIYAGYENGDFFMVRQLRSQVELDRLKAPPGTRYMVQSIERALHKGRYVYLDSQLQQLKTEDRPDYSGSYDPRKRDWYTRAVAADRPLLSNPYLFFSDHQVGVTMAWGGGRKATIIGADIQMQTLNTSLGKQKVTPGSQLALIDQEGHMFAHEDAAHLVQQSAGEESLSLASLKTFGIPILKRIWQDINLQHMPDTGWIYQTVQIGNDAWNVSINKLKVEGAENLLLLIAVPQEELLAGAYEQRTTAALITLLIVLLSIPMTWWVARSISRPLVTLTQEADAIRRFEFSHPFELTSRVLEVNQLAGTIAKMKRTIQQFLELSDAIAGESNFDRLLPKLLGETISAANASSGILYLSNPQQLLPIAGCGSEGAGLLPDALARLHALSLESSVDGVTTATQKAAGPLMARALSTGEVQEGLLSEEDFEALGLVDAFCLDGQTYGTAVPLMNRRRELTGAMLLLSSHSTDQALLAFVAAFSGTAAVSLEAQAMIKEQKELFESFIRLVANAIDTKSAYTGGHCARVPELVKMLAQATCEVKMGPYEHFRMDEHDWETLRIAAWLHDCGKVTTPEYVVDKATRLETLYNRIKEVRMRFEVLKRDAQLKHLERLLAGQSIEVSQRQLDADWQGIDDDFGFVAQCNQGSETITPEKRERLWRIAQKTWLRTLDNRLGLSQQELARMSSMPDQPLPVRENVLTDSPEHRFERTARDIMPTSNPWGIQMTVPPLLYDQGELHNLCIQNGTLTDEERHKINDHIVQTEIMLSGLPFPRHLRRVPSIASAHHEKLDGTGYPKGLHAQQLSPEARMLAIADIFEALTASDRPYKKGLKLSEAIRILARMRDNNHIDADLFDIFLRSGIYRRYAQSHMPSSLVDDVNVEDFLQKKG